MLERIRVHNYKCLVDFDLDLGELTLLLGVNGAGKSSVLDVILAVRELLSGRPKVTDVGIFPASTLTKWRRAEELRQNVDLRVRLGDEVLDYRLQVEHEAKTKRARITLERLSAGDDLLFEFRMGSVQLYRDDGSLGPDYTSDWSESALARIVPSSDNERLTSFLDFMRRVVVCRLHPPAFRAEVDDESSVLAVDGSNFGAWYRSVLQEHPQLAIDFNRELGEVMDGLRTIRLVPIGVEVRAVTATFENGEKSFDLYLSELSDGQRAIIALYGLLHLAKGSATSVFLDEPDNYVALAEIQPWLAALAEVCGSELRQAVLCSHHPELIDYLGGQSGRLLSRESSGRIAVGDPGALLADSGLRLSELIARGWER